MSKITMMFNPVWHRMLYSCTHMATVCVKGSISLKSASQPSDLCELVASALCC